MVFVFLARVLGPGDFGKFTFSITFSTLFMYFAEFGLSRIAVLEISRNKELINGYFSNVVVSKLFLSIGTFALIWLVINVMAYPEETRVLVYLFSISVIVFSYTDMVNAIFRGIERLEYETVVTLISNLALISSICWAVAMKYAVMAVALSFIFSRLIGFVLALGILHFRIGKISFHFDFVYCKRLLRKALPFALLAGVAAVLFDIDTVLLSYLKGNQLVGYYQAAMKVVVTATVIPLILDGSFFPVLSKLYDEKHLLERAGQHLMAVLFFIGVPLAIGLFVLADRFIIFVYGKNFLESVGALQILSSVLLLRFSMRGYEVVLMATGKEKIVFYVILLATIWNICLNIYAIPKFGMTGAAAVAAATHLFILISYIVVTRKVLRIFMFSKSVFLMLLLGTLPGVLIYDLNLMHSATLITIYGISYLGSTFLVLKKERMSLFRVLRPSDKVIDSPTRV